MLPAISCAASWATVRRRPSWRARPTSRTGSWLAWSILESGRGKSPPSRSPCAGHGAPFLGGRPNREPISSELGLCCAAVRRGYWLRVPVGIGPRDALGKDLVVEVGPRFGVFVRLVHEVGIDRFRGEIHFTRHLVAPVGVVARP